MRKRALSLGALTGGGSLLVAVLLLTALVAPVAHAADTDLVITEIMQNPSVLYDTVGEWFEIHNTGPDPVDLQGWTIKDLGADSYTFPTGTPIVIAAGDYAVVARDSLTMVGEGVTVLWQYSNFLLSNSDDEIILLNASMAPIDTVAYDGGPTWPDPTGASMQWNETTGDNNDGANWFAPDVPTFGSGDAGTPNQANSVNGGTAPDVNNVIHRPLVVEATDTPVVTADVTDADGTIASVLLYTRVDGGSWTSQPMSLGTAPSYSATIGAQPLGSVVDYYVEATDNDGLVGVRPATAPTDFFSYTVQTRTITPISSIHADSLGYAGQLVTIEAQVYCPGDYKADGTTVSAYVQDSSGRGINIFGDYLSTGMDLLNDTSNIVRISGTVKWYYSTAEIVQYEVVLVSTGNPELTPVTYSTGDAAAPSNEGTFIKSSGLITDIATTGGSNPAHNFTIDDGSGPVVIRIDDDVVSGLETWALNDSLEAAGAGSSYSGQGQILVCQSDKVTNWGQGVDTTPPELSSATLTGASEVTVQFSEDVDATTGGTAGNYLVYEQATPSNTIAVTSATVQTDASQVVLALASPTSSGVLYVLRVNNVEDLAGNVIATDSEATIVDPNAPVNIVINEIMQNPTALGDTEGEWFEVYNAGSSVVDMNGWTIRDNGIDNHVIDNGGPLLINPGEYKVFGRDATAMAGEGVTLFYQYSNITLGNADDELFLIDTTQTVQDSVLWDGGPVWPDPAGASMQWRGTGDNNDGSQWFWRGFAFGSGDLGSPGAPNSEDTVTDVPGRVMVDQLGSNFPNPFNPRTSFSFSLAQDSQVSLKVFDTRGRLVRTIVDENLKAGSYDRVYSWDGRNDAGRVMPSGIYFYRLSTDAGFTQSRKMTLLK